MNWNGVFSGFFAAWQALKRRDLLRLQIIFSGCRIQIHQQVMLILW